MILSGFEIHIIVRLQCYIRSISCGVLMSALVSSLFGKIVTGGNVCLTSVLLYLQPNCFEQGEKAKTFRASTAAKKTIAFTSLLVTLAVL